MAKYQIQDFPVTDSPNNDAFEAIVELYFQVLGYITSSGKWFWVWEKGKRQRGYQDIDVLAVKDRELIIISVTSNMDDKLSLDNSGKIRKDLLIKLKSYFTRVELYLKKVPQYKWLSRKRIKHIIAYNHSYQGTHSIVEATLNKNGIKIISAKKMLRKINSYLNETKNIKVQNQMLRTIQVINLNGKIEIYK